MMTSMERGCPPVALALAYLATFGLFAFGCGKSRSDTVVSAEGVPASDIHVELFQVWTANPAMIELRMQLRHTDDRGDILRLPAGEVLTLTGVGDLREALEPAAGDPKFQGLVPVGLHYWLVSSAADDAVRELHWTRLDGSVVVTSLQPATPLSAKSFEYCHSVGGDNYALVRFRGSAPATADTICGDLGYGCFPDTCEAKIRSCSVDDFRVRFNAPPQEVRSGRNLKVRLTRESRSGELPGYRAASYVRLYDTGLHPIKDDGLCVKP